MKDTHYAPTNIGIQPVRPRDVYTEQIKSTLEEIYLKHGTMGIIDWINRSDEFIVSIPLQDRHNLEDTDVIITTIQAFFDEHYPAAHTHTHTPVRLRA